MPQTGQVGGRQTIDTQDTNRLTPAPVAIQAPDADLIRNASSQPGVAVSNATNRLTPPPVEEMVIADVPPVQYQTGGINVQRIGPGVKI